MKTSIKMLKESGLSDKEIKNLLKSKTFEIVSDSEMDKLRFLDFQEKIYNFKK